MNVDFPLILVLLTLISGLIGLFDILYLAPRRKETKRKMPKISEYARSFFPVFLIVLIIRSFLAQPFVVPTGSLEPTILPHDLVAVSQFSYGLRLPVLNTKILSIGEPKIGDIAVFRYPPEPSINYVKRVIGTPGDHVVYKNRQLTINGKVIPQKYLDDTMDVEPGQDDIASEIREETLNGVKHKILLHKGGYQELGEVDVIVPQGMYFMMGDNRDNSGDSRYWGFVPEKDLIGKAFLIWFSWDTKPHFHIRWNRIGTIL